MLPFPLVSELLQALDRSCHQETPILVEHNVMETSPVSVVVVGAIVAFVIAIRFVFAPSYALALLATVFRLATSPTFSKFSWAGSQFSRQHENVKEPVL